MSWRDEVSRDVAQDFDELFEDSVETILQQLAGSMGPLQPIALSRDFTGKTTMSVAGSEKLNTAKELLNSFGSLVPQLRTIAVAFEVEASGDNRRICVWLESREKSLQLLQDFRISGSQSVDLGGVTAGIRQPTLNWEN